MTTQTSELAESQRRRQSEQSCIASASQLRGGVVGIHASFADTWLLARVLTGDCRIAS